MTASFSPGEAARDESGLSRATARFVLARQVIPQIVQKCHFLGVELDVSSRQAVRQLRRLLAPSFRRYKLIRIFYS